MTQHAGNTQIAFVALTDRGAETARRARAALLDSAPLDSTPPDSVSSNPALARAVIYGKAGRVTDADQTFDDTLACLRDLYSQGWTIIGLCATGILIRALAPLALDKWRDAPVLSLSEDGAVVVPLLGGHRGANALAADLAQRLGAFAAITTAGDRMLGFALDDPPAVAIREDTPGTTSTVKRSERRPNRYMKEP
jgi:cobalamin biosynthesis protein CbiG